MRKATILHMEVRTNPITTDKGATTITNGEMEGAAVDTIRTIITITSEMKMNLILGNSLTRPMLQRNC
jgi:hypothetical protein